MQIKIKDDAEVYQTCKYGKQFGRIVLVANINKPIIDADAIQQSASYDKWGCMI